MQGKYASPNALFDGFYKVLVSYDDIEQYKSLHVWMLSIDWTWKEYHAKSTALWKEITDWRRNLLDISL